MGYPLVSVASDKLTSLEELLCEKEMTDAMVVIGPNVPGLSAVEAEQMAVLTFSSTTLLFRRSSASCVKQVA